MPELTLDAFKENINRIRAEVGAVIVGQDEVVTNVLAALIGGGHVLLEGVPGLGKTMLVRTLAQVLDLKFARLQFTPDLMPADIIGTDILDEDERGRRSFRFQPGPIFANLLLADEINRATPKTQSALLEAMQEQTVTVSDHTYPLAPPFFVLATQNPIEMEGTYPLPEAQLDRFLFKLDVRYPSQEEVSRILARTTGQTVPQAGQVIDGPTLLAMRDVARQVPIAGPVLDAVSALVLASHPTAENAPPLVQQFVRYGASPRAGQAIIIGAKVMALMAGRFNVAFSDLAAVAPHALRHRLILNFEGEAEGVQPDDIVAEILQVFSREQAA
ncbi:MAG: AAA family ATPase [Anaerolineae bacterium]